MPGLKQLLTVTNKTIVQPVDPTSDNLVTHLSTIPDILHAAGVDASSNQEYIILDALCYGQG